MELSGGEKRKYLPDITINCENMQYCHVLQLMIYQAPQYQLKEHVRFNKYCVFS